MVFLVHRGDKRYKVAKMAELSGKTCKRRELQRRNLKTFIQISFKLLADSYVIYAKSKTPRNPGKTATETMKN